MTLSRSGRIAASLALAAALTLEATLARGGEAAPDGLGTILAGESAAGGLTADAAARRAVATSHELDARRSETTAATEDARQVEAGYLPRNKLSFSYTRLSHVDQPAGSPFDTDHPNQYRYRSEVTVPVSDYFLRLPQQRRAARLSVRAARELEHAGGNDVELDARLAYYDWVRARLQVRVAELALAQSQKHAETSHHTADIGTTTRADALRVDAQVADSNLALERARNQEIVAREKLRSQLHDGDQVVYRVGEDILVEPAARPADFASLWREARANRAELKAHAAQSDAASEQAAASRAGWLPRLDLVGGLDYANPNQHDFPPAEKWSKSWDVTVQATWTVTELVGGRAGTRAAEARVAAARSRQQLEEDQVRLEVLDAYERYRGALTAIEASTIGLQAAEEAYRVRRELFENGRSTSLELTDAELSLTQARLDAIDARVDLRVALALIAHAIGAPAAA